VLKVLPRGGIALDTSEENLLHKIQNALSGQSGQGANAHAAQSLRRKPLEIKNPPIELLSIAGYVALG